MYVLREGRAVAKRRHHVIIAYHTHTPRTSPSHVTTAMTADARRQSLPARSASSSRQGSQPWHVAAWHTHTHTQTHTRIGYAQDHVITHVLGAIAHSCEHSSCHAALHACGAEGRRSCRGGVAVTPPQSCWSAQLQAAASSRQSDSDSHTRHTGGITK
eukprot:SAG25_NODE_3069_length_1233_cov_267.818318_1_plen_157_part_10